jgi:uncharacterized membrane protein YagU involved in acid resistance
MTFSDKFIRQNSQCINTMYLNIILNKTLSIVIPNMHNVPLKMINLFYTQYSDVFFDIVWGCSLNVD